MAFFAIDRNTRPEDAMYWHVTGKDPHPEVDTTEPNCMNKIVQWMRDETVPVLKKIGMAALGVLATLAFGFIIGKTVLVCTVVTAITLLWAKRESLMIDGMEKHAAAQVRDAARTLEEQNAALARIKGALGGEEAYNALPNLDLAGRMGHSGYIDFLRPADLAQPIMKGNDKFGRPFFAMKVQLIGNAQEVAVFVGFQRFTEGGRWDYRGIGEGWASANDDFHLEEIRRIRAGEDQEFVLAAAP